ncbi:alpha/beta hydrolase [Silicimonas algicola]|uniref:Acetyl esterase n=1 Tax=Silicimonas algicola TaxID=1826607 RepID=A0A316G157_9RHOB|nr:alpha/beta hydrolase [Silicimonas algicola]PWK54651.1 acetyl esterase [Silicimonas algicola]
MAMTRGPWGWAEGMERVHEISETFADDAEAAAYWVEGADGVHSVEDMTYTGAAGQRQRLRLYRAGADDAPVLVYIHGGGWVGGTIDLNDRACRRLAGAGWHVASVSYRLAPANPFPAGLDDVIASVGWLQSAGLTGLDTTRLAIGGASAGANLALAAALSLPRETFRALVLFYGVFGNATDTESHRAYADAPVLTGARVDEIYDLYDPGARFRDDPRFAPLLGDLKGLPPVLNLMAEHDVLRSEGEALTLRLHDAGVEVEAWTEPGVSHGFINRGRLAPSADAALARSRDWLARQA